MHAGPCCGGIEAHKAPRASRDGETRKGERANSRETRTPRDRNRFGEPAPGGDGAGQAPTEAPAAEPGPRSTSQAVVLLVVVLAVGQSRGGGLRVARAREAGPRRGGHAAAAAAQDEWALDGAGAQAAPRQARQRRASPAADGLVAALQPHRAEPRLRGRVRARRGGGLRLALGGPARPAQDQGGLPGVPQQTGRADAGDRAVRPGRQQRAAAAARGRGQRHESRRRRPGPRRGRVRRRPQAAQGAQVRRRRLRQGIHQELPPQGPQEDPHRRKAVPVHVGGLHVEVCSFGRADATLPQAHRPEAVQVPSVSALLLSQRSSLAPYEEALISALFASRIIM